MPFEEQTRVFIVRLWREPRTAEGGAPTWRGSIETVPPGDRKFVNTPAQIGSVIEALLEGTASGGSG